MGCWTGLPQINPTVYGFPGCRAFPAHQGRLLLAFFGTSALAILGAVVAVFAFIEISSIVDRLTRQQVPAGFAAL